MPPKERTLDSIGEGAMAALRELVDAMVKANEADDDDARDAAMQAIYEDPLDITIVYRGPARGTPEPDSYECLLATGGPAVRIVGELDQYGEHAPGTGQLQVQDWFTPWTTYDPSTNRENGEVLDAYMATFGPLAAE